MGIDIRLATKDDFDNCFGLKRELYASEAKTSRKDPYLKLYLQTPNKKEFKKEFAEMLRKRGSFFFVGEADNKVVGFQYGFINYYLVGGRRNYFGYLDTLIVSKKYRGLGVGSGLIKKSFGWLKDRGIKWSMLRVDERNKEAKYLYKKLGFYPTELMMVKRI